MGSQGSRVEGRVGLQRRFAHRRRAHPAAREDLAHREGRARQGEDVLDAGQGVPRAAAGLLMTRRTGRSGRGAGAGSARGVALILVLTTIAILTSIGVDFSYSSRVSLRLAENARDELRAYYLARSAVNLSRLLLHFQKQVDQMGGQVASAVSGLMGTRQGTPGQPALTRPT